MALWNNLKPAYCAEHSANTQSSPQKGIYVALAALFGSLAVYKFSRSESSDPASVGDTSKQPLITRFLHNFDYFGEQNARRNDLFTNMIQQAGHDRNLFEGTPGSQHVELKSSEWVLTGPRRR